MNYSLVEITTKDGLIHQGVYVEPPKKSKTAILFVHGLTSAFYHNLKLQSVLIEASGKKGIGYAAFNNRGHDFITSTYVVDKTSPKGKRHITIGAGVEDFSLCIDDIDAGVSFLKEKGYSSIILIGHSTGANKVCYYIGIKKDHQVTGVVLASPISDRLTPALKYAFLKRLLLRFLIGLGFGDKLFTNLNFFPVTPRRALSLLEPHSEEDIFDYGDKHPQMSVYSQIIIPMSVVFGEADEYADRPIKSIKQVFDKYQQSKHYQSTIISGALHGFDGKEKKFSRNIIDWIATI